MVDDTRSGACRPRPRRRDRSLRRRARQPL